MVNRGSREGRFEVYNRRACWQGDGRVQCVVVELECVNRKGRWKE